LAICKQLVELMRGQIGVESLPGRGSTFWFSVRLEGAIVPAPSPAPLPLFAAHRILLAITNATERRTLAHALQRRGADVREVNNGTEALTQLEILGDDGPLPCLIADDHFPDHGGFELARFARKNPAFRQAAIVVLESRRRNSRQTSSATEDVVRLRQPVRPAALQRELIRLWTGGAPNAS